MGSPRRLRACLPEIVKPLARPPVNPSALLPDGLAQRGSTQLVCGHRVSELAARLARRASHLLGNTATLNPISTRRTLAGPLCMLPASCMHLQCGYRGAGAGSIHGTCRLHLSAMGPLLLSHTLRLLGTMYVVCVIPQAAVVMGPKRIRLQTKKRASNHGGGTRAPPQPSEPRDPPPNPVAKPSSSSSSSDC